MDQVKAAILVDGGFLRAQATRAHKVYDPDLIESFARACLAPEEFLLRILYYDCAPFAGDVKLPVSGAKYTFTSNDHWLNALSYKDNFAVRRGVLKFRGFKPKNTPVSASGTLTDADFSPDFEQKGVDMRIGLDIAAYSDNHAVERIILVSNDTDCVPALKYARKAGLQTVLVEPEKVRIAPELIAHADFKRPVPWP